MKTLAAIFIISLFACSCISDKKQTGQRAIKDQADSGSTPPSEDLEHMPVQAKWQESFLQIVQEHAHVDSEAWALFSYSGWADSGQIMIFTDKNKQSQVYFINPGSKTINHKKDFAEADFQTFTTNLKPYHDLKDFQMQAMDGTQWEYLRIYLNDQGQIETRQKVFMNNPGLSEQGKAHSELVKTFLELWQHFGIR